MFSMIRSWKAVSKRFLRFGRNDRMSGMVARIAADSYTFRPNFFSSSPNEIWIIVGRPCGQQ